jgi:hypothetical protein
VEVKRVLRPAAEDGVTNRGLHWDRVLSSTVALKIVATSLDTLSTVMLEGPFENVEDLKQCLKASAAVPVFAGGKPVVGPCNTSNIIAYLRKYYPICANNVNTSSK